MLQYVSFNLLTLDSEKNICHLIGFFALQNQFHFLISLR